MRAYQRLLQYVQVHTTSDPTTGTHPSTQRQFDLARMLADELRALGVGDADVDEHCYVYGHLPATPGCEGRPALGLIAHMDTAPDASGEKVQPILHENYAGRDVTRPGTGAVMKVADFPFLASMKGETLITTDGTTLLGADDKAGVAEIITAVETLIQDGLPHGPICIAFTPGLSVHTGSAKGTMVNAANVAMEYHLSLPRMARPETTEGREGFYHLCQMTGDVTEAKLGYILRDHDAAKLEYKKDNMRQAADSFNGKYGPGTVTVELKDGYRNMIEKIRPHFHLVETARTAIQMAGLVPEEVPVRGGTDGAVLSWQGLPCPNLGTGGFNFHGVLECITAERMDKATQVVLNIIALYAKAD